MKHLSDRKFMGKVHLFMMGVWTLPTIPTVLWWSESVLWVLIISIYANVVGHFASYQSTRAEENGGT